ncbi:MAG TPA: hypothetical protein VIL08_05630, partial [Limnochorda sp.]
MERQDEAGGILEQVRALAAGARQAARWLAAQGSRERKALLLTMAEKLQEATPAILEANGRDVAEAAGRPPAFRDRLTLN